MADEFQLVIDNPGEARREVTVHDLDEARAVASEQTRPGGTAELIDRETSTTIWVRDGTTGQELQPGG